MTPISLAVVLLALLYAFLNGINDSSNIVATMISSRALSLRGALGLTAIAEFLGPFILGIAVSRTIGPEFVQSAVISTHVILAAVASAIIWILVASSLGFPSSSSHALIGGLIGAAIISAGVHAIKLAGLGKILLFLFVSPLIGFVVGLLIFKILKALSRNATPKINIFFRQIQILMVIILGLSHGSNDAPKTMGMITLALLADKYLPTFSVPTWVILLSALAIAAGTAVGGQRLIHTVGNKFYRIAPIDAFSTQLSSAMIVVTATLAGGPVSTSQIISSAIMGTGAGERANKVRWKIAQDIGFAWLLTIPTTALVAVLIYKILTILLAK